MLPQLWHRLQLCLGFDPWPQELPYAAVAAKKKKEKKKRYVDEIGMEVMLYSTPPPRTSLFI